jgi:hypothetical protein
LSLIWHAATTATAVAAANRDSNGNTVSSSSSSSTYEAEVAGVHGAIFSALSRQLQYPSQHHPSQTVKGMSHN